PSPAHVYTLSLHDALPIFSLAVDRYGGGLTRVATMPRYKLSLQDVYAAIRYLPGKERALEELPRLAEAPGVSEEGAAALTRLAKDRKSTRLNSSHDQISYA